MTKTTFRPVIVKSDGSTTEPKPETTKLPPLPQNRVSDASDAEGAAASWKAILEFLNAIKPEDVCGGTIAIQYAHRADDGKLVMDTDHEDGITPEKRVIAAAMGNMATINCGVETTIEVGKQAIMAHVAAILGKPGGTVH